MTDVKSMPSSCFESQCSDLELLKCCAALSECTKSDVSICSLITPCSLRCFTVAATKKRML